MGKIAFCTDRLLLSNAPMIIPTTKTTENISGKNLLLFLLIMEFLSGKINQLTTIIGKENPKHPELKQ